METKPKLVVLDTMNFFDIRLRNCQMKCLVYIRINDEEARQLSREYSLVKAAAKFSLWDQIRCNALFLLHDLQVLQPLLATRRSFDPTGAGDTLQV
jgi:hypothetical protein